MYAYASIFSNRTSYALIPYANDNVCDESLSYSARPSLRKTTSFFYYAISISNQK